MHSACDPSSASVTGSKSLPDYTCPVCKDRDPAELAALLQAQAALAASGGLPAAAADPHGLTQTLTDLVDDSGLQDIENFEMFRTIKG